MWISFIGVNVLLFSLLWHAAPFSKKIGEIKKRICIATVISLCGIQLRVLALILLFDNSTSMGSFMFFLLLLLVQSTSIILFVGFIEKSRRDSCLSKELKKLEKLKTISEITASISHEVRNPLTVTKGFLQLLQYPHLTNQEKESYIKTALEALEKAKSTIGDYLAFAKPSLDDIKILNLKEELTHAIKIMEPFAVINNIHIEFKIYTNVFIAGENQKLHQCLINLTKNAVEAMPQGGNLIISLKEQDGKALIAVTDNGVGMTEEQIERLGMPYYTTKEKGTGLGTMVIFSIVKAMRGEIKVESTQGKGTCFSAFLPSVEQSLSSISELVSYH